VRFWLFYEVCVLQFVFVVLQVLFVCEMVLFADEFPLVSGYVKIVGCLDVFLALCVFLCVFYRPFVSPLQVYL